MCELMAISFRKPLYADISIRAFAVRDVENADGWGLAWYPDRSLAIAKEPLTWRNSEYAEFLQTYAHLYSQTYIGHVRAKTVGGPPTRADTHPFSRELHGREYCFAHNGTIRSARKDLLSTRFRPIGGTDSEQVFCHLMDEIAQRSEIGGRTLRAAPPREAVHHRWLHEKFLAINGLGKFNCLFTDGQRLWCYHDFNGFKGLCYCPVPANSHRAAHHLDDPTIHIDFETDAENHGVILATVPLNDNPGWQRFQPGELIAINSGRIVYSGTLLRRARAG